MYRSGLFLRPLSLGRISTIKSSSNIPIDVEKVEAESSIIDEETKLWSESIEQKRDKSRLKPHHRNILMNKNPYPETFQPYQDTLRYKRKLFGNYGFASGIDPSICWPTQKELQDSIEYEKVAYPFTIPEMIKTAQEARNLKNEEIRKSQQEMLNKLSKLEGWKRDMELRIAKKEAQADAARQKKERLIEEVRKHFGYKVDPKDDKFKELLEKKEKEQKKLAKEERKKEKEAMLLEKLKSKKKDNIKVENEMNSSVVDGN